MKDNYKKLVKNTYIFALGTFGSKLLLFLIVPLYTYILSTSDYGTIDLITSTVSLLIPFSTMLIYEAAIRFLIGKETNETKIFNNSIFIFIMGSIFVVLISPIVLYLLGLEQYLLLFICLIILSSYTTIFGQYLRAKGDNWSFSISGIINTAVTIASNLILLLVFKKGINGYIYSLIISHLITGFYIFKKANSTKLLNCKYIDFKILKSMLIYSLPLIPSNIMWWIMNAGDKYVINYFLGTSANGIFSVSYKIPTIITMVFSIFMQAWQVSAIEERISNTKKEFYKNVFKYISLSLMIIASFIIIFIKPLFEIVISSEFVSSWMYVPLLSIATLLNCFSTFAGVVYIVQKNSNKSFHTTFFGAVLNLAINFLLIRKLGLLGITIGTAVGYLGVMILRFKDFKKYFDVSLIDIEFIIGILILILDAIVCIYVDGVIKYIITIICSLLIIFISRKYISNIISIVKKRLTKKETIK